MRNVKKELETHLLETNKNLIVKSPTILEKIHRFQHLYHHYKYTDEDITLKTTLFLLKLFLISQLNNTNKINYHKIPSS